MCLALLTIFLMQGCKWDIERDYNSPFEIQSVIEKNSMQWKLFVSIKETFHWKEQQYFLSVSEVESGTSIISSGMVKIKEGQQYLMDGEQETFFLSSEKENIRFTLCVRNLFGRSMKKEISTTGEGL